MKRKCPEKPTEPQKEPKLSEYPCDQKYEILGLSDHDLLLCPIEPDEVYLCPRIRIDDDDNIITVEVKDDDVALDKIPGFEHGGLDLYGELLGTEKDDTPTVGALRERLEDMNSRQREVDKIVVCVARTLLPLCKEIWDGDIFGCDSTQISLACGGSASGNGVKVSVSFAYEKIFRPNEIKWLTEMQAKLLTVFTQCRNQWSDFSLWMPEIKLVHSRDCTIWNRWTTVGVTAQRESICHLGTTCQRKLDSSFDIYRRKDGDLGWRFLREPFPFFAFPSKLKGKTTWDEGFPPLFPSFNFGYDDDKNYHAYASSSSCSPRLTEPWERSDQGAFPRSAYDRKLLRKDDDASSL